LWAPLTKAHATLQELEMAGAPQREPARMSRELFRGFVECRPDEEHWQLIDGVAVMMAPPTLAHQRIASNLQRLLEDALDRHNPAMTAFQRGGVELGSSVPDYDPEPDVLVVDADASLDPNKRYADRFYLAAEIVSETDRVYVEKKRDIYKLHEACVCILIVQQDRVDVRLDLRTDSGWDEQVLKTLDGQLILADFGLRCRVEELYRGTALAPRRTPRG
jgi:Uma2 family endonuclease